MYGYLRMILRGLLIVGVFSLCLQVCGLSIAVINDPSSRVGGRHQLTLKVTTTKDIPQPASILVNLGTTNKDCSYYVGATLPTGAVQGCSISEDMLKLTTNTALATGAETELTFDQVEYSRSMVAKELTVKVTNAAGSVTETGTNSANWVPLNLATLTNFGVVATANVVTCEQFELTFSGIPHLAVEKGSRIEIFFDADVDISGATSSNLVDGKSSNGVFAGNSDAEYVDPNYLVVTVEKLMGPSIAKEFSATITIYATNAAKVYEDSRKFLVTPGIFTHEGSIRHLRNSVICKKGVYSVEIESRCGTVPSALYEIIPPLDTFGDQYITFTSDKDLETSEAFEFEFNNPCVVIPGPTLSTKTFTITVYNGITKEAAFILNSKLSSETTYTPGELKNFEVVPQNRQQGSECPYNFFMRNSHSIPKNGDIVFMLNSAVAFVSNTVATVNGIETSLSHSNGKITVAVPEYISAMTDIEIVLGNFKNSYDIGEYLRFTVSSYNTDKHEIDKSELATAVTNEPESVSVTCQMSSARNLEQAEYAFTFTSDVTQIAATDVLGIKVPTEIDAASCSLVGKDAATPPTEEPFDFWLKVEDIATDNPITTLQFKLSCRNPSITKETSSFELLVFKSDGTKSMKGEVKVRTTAGSGLDLENSSMHCDKHCPKCETTCTLVLERRNSQKFRSIVITNDRLDLDKLTCAYDEDGQSFLSTCTSVPGDSQTKIKITLSTTRSLLTITVINLNLIYPEHSTDQSSPLRVQTYATENVNAEALIDEDELPGLTVECSYPCKTCGETHDQCTSCTDELVGGRHYYLYAQGVDGCSSTAGATCRELENENCCSGYLKDEESRQCLKCNDACKTCEGSKNTCTKCQDSNRFLYNGECKESCEGGAYADSSSGDNLCLPCSDGCEICLSSTQCTKCYSGYNFHEGDESCTKECPKGTYLDAAACKVCAPNCAACRESSATCTECHADRPERFLLDGACVSLETCEAQNRIADSDDNTCEPCSSDCDECTGKATHCSRCKDGKYLNESEGTCLATCVPSGYNVDGVDGVGGKCAPCENNCKTCLSATECVTCIDGQMFNPTTRECKASCPERYYERNRKCIPCSSFCAACDNPNTCVSCVEGYSLSKGLCYLGECPAGSFRSSEGVCEECDSKCATCRNTKEFCTDCAPNYYMSENKCIETCPAGTTVIKSVCEPCSGQCLTCNGAVDSCTSCQDDKYLYRGQCLDACPTSTTPDLASPKACIDCAPGCRECTWDSVNDAYPQVCTSCLPAYRRLDSLCYALCPDGYTASEDECVEIATASSDDMWSTASNYLVFPHLIVAGFLAALLIKQGSKGKALLSANLLVLLNYLAIISYVLTMITAASKYKTEIMAVTLTVIILQIVLNLLFLIAYKKVIAPDPGLKLWGVTHNNAKKVILTLSTIFSFQTIRLFYSRLLDFDMFFIKFRNFNSFFKPVNHFSILQLVLVQGTVVIFYLIELARLPYGTMNYTFMIESFTLSFLVLLLLCFEIKSTESLIGDIEKEINAAILGNQSGSNQSMSSGSMIEERSMTKQILKGCKELGYEPKATRNQNTETPMKATLPAFNRSDSQSCSIQVSKNGSLGLRNDSAGYVAPDAYLHKLPPIVQRRGEMGGAAEKISQMQENASLNSESINMSNNGLPNINRNPGIRKGSSRAKALLNKVAMLAKMNSSASGENAVVSSTENKEPRETRGNEARSGEANVLSDASGGLGSISVRANMEEPDASLSVDKSSYGANDGV